MCVFLPACTCVCVCMCVCVCVSVCVSACMRVCMCVLDAGVHACVYIYVCVCTYICTLKIKSFLLTVNVLINYNLANCIMLDSMYTSILLSVYYNIINTYYIFNQSINHYLSAPHQLVLGLQLVSMVLCSTDHNILTLQYFAADH